MIKICIAGITGKVGNALAARLMNEPGFMLVGAVSRSFVGRPLFEAVKNCSLDLRISGSVEDALRTETDVLIDYTSPTAVKSNIQAALQKGVHIVIGTSGLTTTDYEEIDQRALAKGIGVVAAGNFSITAALMQHFAVQAARHLDQWEVLDYGGASKSDAPSGTSRETAFLLSQVKQPKLAVSLSETLGDPSARGATVEATQVHSIRLPGFYSSSEVLFGAPSERLSIRHDSLGAEPYLAGTLLAARKVVGKKGLTRGLMALIEA